VHAYWDVRQDARKLDEMLRLTGGKRKVPVIVQGQKVTIGFDGGA
jgi:glutaredoxin 3